MLHSAMNEIDRPQFEYYCKFNDLKNARRVYSRGYINDKDVIDVIDAFETAKVSQHFHCFLLVIIEG